ncbi:Multidrug efflux pump subunit AcrB [Allopseudospirillum japonicum]|uniref:Multidrug efflux pump subunit AcrB n=1 Tax=Allopseudospirillum japonicum TaxID=64971 RepID=A0A1H6SJY7_9GAMM|nr:efflux RND transporter permease subunit [Allopseudospirillum japonicum]SEI64125.1 Multidrug efflux pump subunit AcrB [Allopseudospirillum japonicum]
MIAWFARNHVAANLLMLTLLGLGLASLTYRIPLEVFPSFAAETISVRVSLRGATPADAELSLALPIEQALADLQGIEEISSRSVEGSTSITLQVADGYDPQEVLAEVKARVDAINSLPTEAERPLTSLASRKREVISVAVYGNVSELELRQYAQEVKTSLLAEQGITQVEFDGAPAYEVNLYIAQDKLRQYGLSLQEVQEQIRAYAQDFSAGMIRGAQGDISIRSLGIAYHKDEFARLPVATLANGYVLTLGELAQIEDTFTEAKSRSRFNGYPSVMLDVYRVGDQSALQVAEIVRTYIDQQQAHLPQGIFVDYWDDDSEIVKGRLSILLTNALQGGVLVLVLLTLFLRPAIAFWVFIGIPVSFMGAFLLMPFFGVTLNIFSLFAFILVLGIVVDDAIVTGENVYTHLRHAESGLQAAICGTQEVSVPVTFGILTTVAAFLPMAFIEGARGALFAQIPVIVIPVLLFSLIESKLVLPAHLKNIRLNRVQHPSAWVRWQQAFASGFEHWILRIYQPLLKQALIYRGTTLALFVGVLILMLALVMSGWTRFTFFPRVQSDTARAYLTMPAGTAFAVTDGHLMKMLAAARTLQEKYRDPATGQSPILNIHATSSQESAGIRLQLENAQTRDPALSTRRLVNEWREHIGAIPGAESLNFRAEIGRVHDPIDIQLSSQRAQDLAKAIPEIEAYLRTYPYLFDIANNLAAGKQELHLQLKPQAHALGITRAYLLNQIRAAYLGLEVLRLQRGQDEVKVYLRLPVQERQSLAEFARLPIVTPEGTRVDLQSVASWQFARAPAAIYRLDQARIVSITADVDKQEANLTRLQTELTDYLDQLIQAYPGMKYQLKGETQEQQESFSSLGWGLAFVFFALYALLAIPFASYSQPLIVMSVIPFGIIGALAGHLIVGMDLTMMSLLGILALIGVVVNDSLVLVDFTNKESQGLRESQPAYSAWQASYQSLLRAGAARFRPVFLTSMTTFIGLMPLLFEKSTQAQFLIPMAVSLGFGIIFATLITLIMVPVNYLLLEDLAAWWRGEAN